MRLAAAVAALLLVATAAPPAGAQPIGVEGVLATVVAADGLAGAVAAVRHGDDVTAASAGYADVEAGTTFVPDTRVRVASITKTFVAAAILQLVGEGRVDLDASVEEYLPGLLRGTGIDGDAVTVRRLLRHQSGLPEYYGAETEPLTGPVAPRDLVARALARPAADPSPAVAIYTNTNYVVAGLLLESVTGRPAAEEITRRIIVPLGLTHTYFPAPGERWLRAPMAHGYETVGGERLDVTDGEPSDEYTAGSLISTSEDTAAFVTALLAGRVVAAPELAQMMDTVAWPLHGPGFRYGLGLVGIDLDCGVTVWGHSGDLAGYHSIMVAAPGRPAVSATFTQGSPGVRTLADDPRAKVLAATYCPG
ncbi:beta-lactamase family protein [Mycolicibacterium vaccae]|uniref:Beta-lactamase n=1 Tax=Mycolicibacterium vaccae ATCC 25954 TaxID=1194972 RepID=K0UH05_MYCVA|nr:serine hydrolase domain-containing protein [Mycolicibacterium vaccae]ANI41816.1 beta-lactamase [Mycolicibacterium vaccae 95051]EJZ06487.1 beta-lactamase [Mycolicibacterium vaccae ATCC 25954]MCV7061915.1 beta-lactamase family protein [Mycolicibacterium vaccae]